MVRYQINAPMFSRSSLSAAQGRTALDAAGRGVTDVVVFLRRGIVGDPLKSSSAHLSTAATAGVRCSSVITHT